MFQIQPAPYSVLPILGGSRLRYRILQAVDVDSAALLVTPIIDGVTQSPVSVDYFTLEGGYLVFEFPVTIAKLPAPRIEVGGFLNRNASLSFSVQFSVQEFRFGVAGQTLPATPIVTSNLFYATHGAQSAFSDYPESFRFKLGVSGITNVWTGDQNTLKVTSTRSDGSTRTNYVKLPAHTLLPIVFDKMDTATWVDPSVAMPPVASVQEIQWSIGYSDFVDSLIGDIAQPSDPDDQGGGGTITTPTDFVPFGESRTVTRADFECDPHAFYWIGRGGGIESAIFALEAESADIERTQFTGFDRKTQTLQTESRDKRTYSTALFDDAQGELWGVALSLYSSRTLIDDLGLEWVLETRSPPERNEAFECVIEVVSASSLLLT